MLDASLRRSARQNATGGVTMIRTRRCVAGRWQVLNLTSPGIVMTALLSIVSMSSPSVPRRAPRPWLLVVGLTVVFCLAFAARLIPLLRGGGLHAMGNYDDGVHYASAMGLVHGLLPYRDFLLLHPPGVPLLLTPFAGLAEVLGEPDNRSLVK